MGKSSAPSKGSPSKFRFESRGGFCSGINWWCHSSSKIAGYNYIWNPLLVGNAVFYDLFCGRVYDDDYETLQAKLQEFLGRKELDRHLDADEAIVLGAALPAANLSDGIKLNRKLGMIDGSTYGYVMELDGVDLVKDETTKQVLVPRMKKIPSKVT